MLSEVDLQDWEKVDFSIVHKNHAGQYKLPSMNEMLQFYEQVVELRNKQMKAIPAILRKEV